jgi:F420-0:gamma-glutamyl ligase
LKGPQTQESPDKGILHDFFSSNDTPDLSQNRFKQTILVPSGQKLITAVVATDSHTHQFTIGNGQWITAISGSGLQGNASFN